MSFPSRGGIVVHTAASLAGCSAGSSWLQAWISSTWPKTFWPSLPRTADATLPYPIQRRPVREETSESVDPLANGTARESPPFDIINSTGRRRQGTPTGRSPRRRPICIPVLYPSIVSQYGVSSRSSCRAFRTPHRGWMPGFPPNSRVALYWYGARFPHSGACSYSNVALQVSFDTAASFYESVPLHCCTSTMFFRPTSGTTLHLPTSSYNIIPLRVDSASHA